MRLNQYLLALAITALVFSFSRCIDGAAVESRDPRGAGYASSAACAACHKGVQDAYAHTGHARTSRSLNGQLAGLPLFKDPFEFSPGSSVRMVQRDSGMFQVLYEQGQEVLARRFDLAFGSGDKASSFAYWAEGKPWQLPLSYFAVVQGWANSPGFPAHRAHFGRAITLRCFECHSSYVSAGKASPESITAAGTLDQGTLIYGIDCERCHGPGAAHAAFQTANPAVKEAKFITSWKSLSRQQKLDACAVCHSGNDLTTQQSTFGFVPGDTLSQFYYPEFGAPPAPFSDVHGKQLQLLEASQCFIRSNTLECATCHNPHVQTPHDMAAYSKQCLGCHQQGGHTGCPKEATLGAAIRSNCIGCHMPQQVSRTISFQQTGKQAVSPYLLRTHRIAVYRDTSSTPLH